MKKVFKTDAERVAYDCRKATSLIEKKQSQELIPREQWELQLHLAGCYICRVYEQQSVLINHLMDKLFKESLQEIKLDTIFKEELQKLVKEKIGDER